MKATLRQKHGLFGGELAGHYYFRDNYYADCAVLAVVEVLNLLWHSGKSFSEVTAPLLRYSKSPETTVEGEVFNGVDDNDNGLIDESGFCVERIGGTDETLAVHVTLARRDEDGRLLHRTARTTVRPRNGETE